MEPLKRCVLLALALQVAVLAKDGCREVRTGADRTGRTERTVQECKGSETNSSSSCNINDTACEANSSNTTVDDQQGHVNISRSQPEKLLLFSFHRSENKSSGESQFSTVELDLLRNISDLDLSNFSSAKTVILNTNGFDISKVRGANNVSNLIVTSSSDKNLMFVTFFSYISFLNLSWNNIETFPDSKFPPLISSIDLSFNNISLTGNYSLPPSLRTLNISYNNISNTDGFILKGNVIVLDIRGNQLSRVPVIEMISLEELYLPSNYITTLKEKAFSSLKNMTVLDLRANRLNNIEEKVFQGLNRLQWLDLSENNIISLAPATFQYLSNLVTLLLSKNVNLGNLQEFEDASLLFGTGQRLQEIEASSTNLSRIPSTVTRSVRKLLLTDNTICTIQCGQVDSFPLLQVIDVSNNVISEIEEDALGRLEFLSDLILAGNKLVNVPKSLPNQLQVLDLRCNMIKRLNNTDFLGLQKLRVLLLSRNNISVVEDGAFGQLINLDVLDLSYNPIKTLYRSSFTGPRRLKELYLISMTELIPLKESLSFPAPESSHLEVLHLDLSPELATRLMDDVAALTMFHELWSLSLRGCELLTLRSDLPGYLPRLHSLDITNNPLNCSDMKGLVKWLHPLIASNRGYGKSRLELHNTQYKSCNYVPEHERLYDKNMTCTDLILSDKSLTTLKTEDILILTTEQVTQRPTEPLTPDSSTETLTDTTTGIATLEITTENLLPQDGSSSSPDPTSVSLSTPTTSNQQVTPGFPKETTRPTENTTTHFINHLNKTNPKQFKVLKSENSLNKLQYTWKYFKSKTKTQSTAEPLIILLNDTKHMRVIDNQLNDSISSGAFLAHEAPEAPPSSHPGMMVFLFIVGVILVASSAMVYSHCAQRRSSQYHHQQDIEVSSLGGHELW